MKAKEAIEIKTRDLGILGVNEKRGIIKNAS